MPSTKQKDIPHRDPTDEPLNISAGEPDAAADTTVATSAAGTAVEVYDYGKDAGAGMENVEAGEFSIPFLRIVQTNSPAAQPPELGGLGAKAGSIMNMATNEIYDGQVGIDFVPVHRDHNFLERMPFEAGGDFIGIRSPEDELVRELRKQHGEFGKLPGPEGSEIVETFYLYWLLVQDGEAIGRVLVPFASTQVKKYKGLMARVLGIRYPVTDPQGRKLMVQPPLWAHVWHASTVPESKKNNKWAGWRLGLKAEPAINSRLKLTDPLYAQGREFYDLISAGKAKVDFSKAGDSEAGATEDDEIPM